ncbi:ankyrin [Gonapodya prolifera JEL478]|uniref:Ankyrin n=1 Tax=Gonapodya prolifera (strain JEL478) TaxID=1344416 RepID=A0A138ZZ96_GONPJ|nr:ankyrin [Gonapodya prolifera JEL478]|eukprot:KXS09738.1 ankyrin [Gonapodya prolifera JEL478]
MHLWRSVRVEQTPSQSTYLTTVRIFTALVTAHFNMLPGMDTSTYSRLNDDRALMRASAKGHIDIVRLLLDRGKDVHADNGLALVQAAQKHIDIVRLLLDCGADVHTEDDNTVILSLLLERGANVHTDNGSALQLASVNGHIDVVRLLLNSGADIHARNKIAL